ncbi:MAG: DUF4405 domain-containing protein [Anaerolineae bacterium]|nr:DUF4405 domain-containing protein [Anaerolineae bacterium]
MNQTNIQTKTSDRTKINWILDIVIFLAFLVAGEPQFTGLAIHEWLGLAFGAGILTHIILHVDWVIAITKRIFSALPNATRINYVLNLALFIDIVAIIVSGIAISRVALPVVGISAFGGPSMSGLHHISADLFTPLVGLHIAMHISWIVATFKRYIMPSPTVVARPRISQ